MEHRRKEENIMAKEKRNLYKEVEFGNDYGYAMQVKREAETQLYEIQKIWGLAIAGTVCGGIGMVLAFHPIFIMIGFVMGCVCYSKVGGFGIAAKWAWNIAKFGWFVVPYFLIDLLVGAIALCLGFLSLFFLPFFVVNHIRKQAQQNQQLAEAFLHTCQQNDGAAA